MARRRTFTPVRRTRTIRIPGPTRTRLVRVGRAGVSAAARAARDEKHTLTALLAAAGLGFAKRQGLNLPAFSALGTAGTYGVLAWGLGRYTRNRTMQHVATGLLSIAAFDLAGGGAGYGADISGDEVFDLPE